MTNIFLTFKTFDVLENNERKKLIDALQIKENHKILETGCGTGRDSELIAQNYEKGELFLQDISEEILRIVLKI